MHFKLQLLLSFGNLFIVFIKSRRRGAPRLTSYVSTLSALASCLRIFRIQPMIWMISALEYESVVKRFSCAQLFCWLSECRIAHECSRMLRLSNLYVRAVVHGTLAYTCLFVHCRSYYERKPQGWTRKQAGGVCRKWRRDAPVQRT